ncbi:hypothetical protein C7448_104208 [Tenacibaculum gallaicum]|uniref:Uncharacterized protein n=1 Tax=Tenacibaculum gallaicum TaxID=561505 RepID=A0A3E0HWG6_9FLAO|nr:hypothetical protein [Tenacibaculum gallaicum]REH50596.1 hypothetical protein C7448_104208 [Tenacibaculum gallaicum]
MGENKETNEILQQILKLMAKNEVRIDTKERMSEGDGLIKKAEKEGEDAANKLQTIFDRIHDKLFTINSILIALYIGFAKFPADNPLFSLWYVLLPIGSIFYLVYIEISQMSIFRHASQRMNWNFSTDVEKYGRMINRQNLKSLLAWIITILLVIFLAIKVLI